MSSLPYTFYDDNGPVAYASLDPSIVDAYKWPSGEALDPADWPTAAKIASHNGDVIVSSSKDYDIKFRLDCGVAGLSPAMKQQDGIIGPNDEKLTVIETPSGTYGITIISKQADETRVPAVAFKILNQSGQVIRTATTDANGEKTVTIEAGSYTVVPYKPCVNADSVAFTVASSTTVEVIGVLVSDESEPGKQVVYHYAKKATGAPATTAKIVARTLYWPTWIDNTLITTTPDERTADVNGRLAIGLYKGARVQVEVWDGTHQLYSKTFTVSQEDNKQLKDC
jgi:hypothetical protein